jgi:hypothetical protein
MSISGRGILASLALSLLASSLPAQRAAQEKKPDPWGPVRFLAGEWEGTAAGEGGTGTVRRTYSFVLHDRFIYEKNVSTYPPQAANPAGEVHEHWSMISYDRARAGLVLRQFHQEGFVNQYVVDSAASGPGKLVFASERFENFDNAWRARETYEVRSPDEFLETFELAEPGKEFQVYSRNTFKRVARP